MFEQTKKQASQWAEMTKGSKLYVKKTYSVTIEWVKDPLTIQAFGWPHARNIANKMLGRDHLETAWLKIELKNA